MQSIRISPHGDCLTYIDGWDSLLEIWSLNDLSSPPTTLGGIDPEITVRSVEFTHSGSHLLAACSDNRVRLWSLSRLDRPLELLEESGAAWEHAKGAETTLRLWWARFDPSNSSIVTNSLGRVFKVPTSLHR
ncbi:MAG: WD40 repeat domain-containing protein [Cytophagaceae bacterium]|nr:MAG: WD40 repeat domain-containing protein [Cytophagaceae bacterium]